MPHIPVPFTLQALIADCQQERKRFQQVNDTASPACLEIFRLALHETNEEAWHAINTIFGAQILSWIRFRAAMLPASYAVEDAYQEGFSNFCRGAPKNADLLQADSISRFLAFWQKCVLNAMLEWRRNYHRFEPPPPVLIELKHAAPWWFKQESDPDEDNVERIYLREQLRLRIQELVNQNDPKEALVFQLFFELQWLPREIFGQYAQQFRDYDEVALIIQRLKRRLRGDESLQNLYKQRLQPTDTMSLKISLIEEGVDGKIMANSNEQSCEYDDVTILEYVIGVAGVEISQAIESSPTCMQAAKQMAGELWPLLQATHRLQCPTSAELLDYHQQQISGTHQLVIHRHLQLCPSCQQELNWLQAMTEITEEPLSARIRRVIEAIFQSPLTLPQPLRGESLQYRTPDLFVAIIVRQSSRDHTWTMRIQLRTAEGALVTDQVEKAILATDDPLLDSIPAVTPVAEAASIVFSALEAGVYQVNLLMATEEIVVRDIHIGGS